MVAASSSQLNFPNNLSQARINITASGDSTLIAGAAGKQVRVYRMKLTVASASNILIKDGSTTVLDGPLTFAANGAMVLDFTNINMPPWYITSTGNDLVINNSSGVQLGGNVDYLIA